MDEDKKESTIRDSSGEILEPSKKTPKVRHSGHFVDQKLKYEIPNNGQCTLFDIIDPDIQGAVEKFEVKFEGIRLSTAEERLVTAFLELLKQKSENKDQSSDKFYQGNIESTMVIAFGKEKVKPAHLKITPAELYKAYLGKNGYSGRAQDDIEAILMSLNQKKFLMKYDRKRKEDKKTVTDRIEKFDPIISIIKYTRGLSEDELSKLDNGDDKIRESKGELIIAFHPILTDQIDSKYVEYPQDINKRTIIAAGGQPKNVTISINCLRDSLMRALSNKLSKWEINADKLPYLLKLEKFMREGRKKYVEDSIKSSIQACKNLGLLLNHSIKYGVDGQPKHVFEINKDFE